MYALCVAYRAQTIAVADLELTGKEATQYANHKQEGRKMTRKQYYVALAVLAVTGLAGGGLASWLAPGKAAWAQEEAADVITAREFRVVDEEGKEIASLGGTSPMLRLSSDDWTTSIFPGVLSLVSDSGAVLLTAGQGPSLHFSDAAGEPKMRIEMNAQEGLRYPYLPAKYSEIYIPTVAGWRALQLSTYLSGYTGLSDRLQLTGFKAWFPAYGELHGPSPGLLLAVNTTTQPGWNTHLGKGRFSCSDREVRASYKEASREIMKHVRTEGYFPEIADQNVYIGFMIHTYKVGIWHGGTMKLEGEE